MTVFIVESVYFLFCFWMLLKCKIDSHQKLRRVSWLCFFATLTNKKKFHDYVVMINKNYSFQFVYKKVQLQNQKFFLMLVASFNGLFCILHIYMLSKINQHHLWTHCYNHACPKRGLIHWDRVMQLMKQALYLKATTTGYKIKSKSLEINIAVAKVNLGDEWQISLD